MNPGNFKLGGFVTLKAINFFHIRCVLVCVCFVALSGCVGRFERPKIPSVIAVPSPNGKTGNYTLDQYQRDLDTYSNAIEPNASALRDRMTYAIMAEIDYVFFDYETKLFLNQGRFNVGSDFLQLGLAAGSTLTNGARGKTILSAILSGVTGTSLSVDKNFFRQQTVQAIASSMEANRDRIKTIILQQMRLDSTAYPYQAARADLIRYFFAGTLPAGLQQLHQEAAANAQVQQSNLHQEQVRDISKQNVSDATKMNQVVVDAFRLKDFTKLILFLKAMGAINEDNPTAEKIESALRDLGRRTPVDANLRDKYYREARNAHLIE